ncbi:MAG: hypothetical protein ACLRSW_03555 [Christensenellaceae bacterium]
MEYVADADRVDSYPHELGGETARHDCLRLLLDPELIFSTSRRPRST